MRFASDNTSGAAPEVMAAILKANDGYERSYGADTAMARVTALVREIFEAPEAVIHLVATGTAANALAIATHCQPGAPSSATPTRISLRMSATRLSSIRAPSWFWFRATLAG